MEKNITLADLEGVLEFAYQEEYFDKWARGKIDASEIAHEYLKTLTDSKKTYVLLGSDAVRIMIDEDVFALSEVIRSEDAPSYELVVFDSETSIADILYTTNGWRDYAILSREEYLIIRLLGEEDDLSYSEISEIFASDLKDKLPFVIDFSGVEAHSFDRRRYYFQNGIIYPSK